MALIRSGMIRSVIATRNISRSGSRLARLAAGLMGSVLILSAAALAVTPIGTITALAVSAANVTAGSVVTLTATVTASGTPLTAGQVVFCNASAAYCEDSAVLGSAWVTNSGTATVRRAFATGTTEVKAVFLGTTSSTSTSTSSFLTSASSAQAVTVTGQVSTGTGVNVFSTVGPNAAGVVAGDFNNDGFPDLAVIDSTLNTVQIFLGNGNGTFTAGASIGVALGNPTTIASADFNGDGNLDLNVGLRIGNDGGYLILLGNGDGTFALAPCPTPTGCFPVSPPTTPATYTTIVPSPWGAEVHVADFNGDGHADVVLYGVHDSAGDQGIQVFLGNGDGTFAVQAIANVVVGGHMAIGDFNGDGIPDMVATGANSGEFAIYLGKGDGTFTLAPGGLYFYQTYPWIDYPRGVAVADFNGDGKADLAISQADSHTVTILTGKGDGTFTLGASVPDGTGLAATAWTMAAADFNGDGHTDLSLGANWQAVGDPSLSILPGNGDGTFGAASTFVATPPNTFDLALGVGDFYSTGIPAIALLSGSSPSYVTVLQVGAQSTPGVAASISSSLIQYGQSANVRVQVSCNTACGQVDFRLDGSEWQTVALGAAGNVTLATSSAPGAPLAPGIHSVVIDYLGSGNYNAANSNTITFTIEAATPTLTWATPAPITFGTALSATQLNATASVAGTFVYNPAAGTVPAAGNQTLSVTFIPANTTDYVSVTDSVTLTVNPVVGASYTLAANQTAVAGSSSVTLTLNSFNYAGTVSFSTSVSASAGATGTVTASATPVTLTSNGTATTTLTITATAAAANHAPAVPWNSGGAIAFGVLLVGAPLTLRRKRVLAVLLTAGALTMAGLLISCSGSSQNTTGPVYTVTVTPTGTGTVTNPSPVAVSVTIP